LPRLNSGWRQGFRNVTPRVAVIIPAFNEQDTIAEVAASASRFANVCVVDDASTDATPEIVRGLGNVALVRHERNTHIRGAIMDGFRWALREGYDAAITMDAGMSHDPAAIPRFVEKADLDLVLSWREDLQGVPPYRRLLSRGGTWLMNLALDARRVPWGGAGFRDCTSGYRLYSRRAMELLDRTALLSRSFDFHLEALAVVYRAGLRVGEVPISYRFTNSSLRWPVVKDALRTCRRIWSGTPFETVHA
jgi:dolichol-phosphate mannosyltransferase